MKSRLWIVVGLVVVVLGMGGAFYWHERQLAASVRLKSQQAQVGQQLFQSLCITCHGPGGNGSGGAPVLNDGSVLQKYATTSRLSQFIQTHMPASNPGMLTHQQAQDLALYIKKLNHALNSN